jgi:hypothetical protein
LIDWLIIWLIIYLIIRCLSNWVHEDDK